MILFRMVEILFRLFISNSNRELRRTAAISSPLRNSRKIVILTVSEQQICVWYTTTIVIPKTATILLF
jgi:hypothetical protein